jgi:hypothetical protein
MRIKLTKKESGVTAYGFTKSMLRASKLDSVLDEN